VNSAESFFALLKRGIVGSFHHGGSGGGGAELTAFGHRVVRRYRAIEARAHVAAAADLDALAAAALKSPLDC
jgi:molybdate transport repressor ModE-like protein